MKEIDIIQPSLHELEQIRNYAVSFNLDCSDLSPGQFLIARMNNKITGFVRLKKHRDCTELSTLGVLPEYRSRRLGEILVNRILKQAAPGKIYILTVIPSYFSKLGFRATDHIPDSLKPKKEDCKIHCCTDKVTAMMIEKRADG
jgi:N-acetylglutamate synthase-like GNAT family acetyltransferase